MENIVSFLSKPRSKNEIEKFAQELYADSASMNKLFDIVFNDQGKMADRGSWLMRSCFQLDKFTFQPKLKELIENVRKNPSDAIKRNTYAILSESPLIKDGLGQLTDLAFRDLRSQHSGVAVKIHAMTVLTKMCEKYPALSKEVADSIQHQMPHASAGFISRGKKSLLLLNKIKSLPIKS